MRPLTGLIWTRDAGPGELPMSWRGAFDFVAGLNQEKRYGFADWRLPNRRELRSLVSHQTRRQALPKDHPFINVFPGWYWTSTTAATGPAHAWYVNLDGARMFYGGKDQSFLARPVRGAGYGVLPATEQSQCYSDSGAVIPCAATAQDGESRIGRDWPVPRFEVRDEAVTDRLTGLRWRRVADLARPVVWEEALAAVAAFNRGAPRWRLPNINERESLVDCLAHGPALPGACV